MHDVLYLSGLSKPDTLKKLLKESLLQLQPLGLQMSDADTAVKELVDTLATCSVMAEYLLLHFGLTLDDLEI